MVYYRKYRPQTLQEVIGQQNITESLTKAYEADQLAHAYLFTGPRGTGKTSTARILAKMVNCEGKGENGKSEVPCNKCDSCLSITDGSNLDYIEIDAASNRGIDDIRALRESIKLTPSSARKKIYVIDECFRYEDLITLEDGTKLPIGKIVENKLPINVLSFNLETNTIEAKPIIRYMRKQPHLPTVRLTFNNNRSLVCTINHKFYTPEGLVYAKDLMKGQFVYSFNNENITNQQLEVIAGSALGDGHLALTTSKMRARLSISQGVTQKDYLDYKVQLLGDLIQTLPAYQLSLKSFSKKGTYRVATLSSSQIVELHKNLYDDSGRKKISPAYLNKITALGLAIWYLDDGSLQKQVYHYTKKDGVISEYIVQRSVFNVQGLSREDVNLIKEWLYQKWGIQTGISFTAKGPVIWLTVDGTKQLHEIIASYVHTSMDYKLLPRYRNKFSMPISSKESKRIAVSIVNDIQIVDSPKYVYNIEVADNHNYFVRDILASNCHMLTMEAFNGLLKTLEEPPPHVLFILATTEAHKIPATILSRVQKLDFQMAKPEDLTLALENVVKQEKLEIEPEAINLIAQRAEGSFRDSLKLLDQLSSAGQKITVEMTEQSFKSGTLDDVIELISCINQKNSAAALNIIFKQNENGINLKEFIDNTLEILRNILFIHGGAQSAAKNYLGEVKFEIVKTLAEKIPNGNELLWIDFLHEALSQMKVSSIPALPLEVAVIQSCQQVSTPALVNVLEDQFVSAETLVRRNTGTPKHQPAQTPIISEKTKEKLEEAKIEAEIPTVSTQTDGEDLSKILDKWNYILEMVKPYNYSLEALLKQVKVTSCEDGMVILEVPYSFHQRILEAPKSRDLLESVISDVLGKPGRVSCVLGARPVRVEEIANIELAADDDVLRIAAEIFNS